jgi:hypothetical protein
VGSRVLAAGERVSVADVRRPRDERSGGGLCLGSDPGLLPIAIRPAAARVTVGRVADRRRLFGPRCLQEPHEPRHQCLERGLRPLHARYCGPQPHELGAEHGLRPPPRAVRDDAQAAEAREEDVCDRDSLHQGSGRGHPRPPHQLPQRFEAGGERPHERPWLRHGKDPCEAKDGRVRGRGRPGAPSARLPADTGAAVLRAVDRSRVQSRHPGRRVRR